MPKGSSWIACTLDEIPCLMRMPSLASCPDLQNLRLELSLPLSTPQRDRAALLLRHCLHDIVACAPSLCELDLVFNFYKVYAILDEVFLAGEIEETSKQVVLTRLEHLDKLE